VSASKQKWVTLGRVSGVFGVKGWLKVQSYTDPRDNIARYGAWTLRSGGVYKTFGLEDGRSHGGSVVAKLQGLEDRDRAREWVGADVVVERERLPAAAPGELYWTDLEGLEVRTTTGVVLGKVEHLLATGANDVLVLDGQPPRLIPFDGHDRQRRRSRGRNDRRRLVAGLLSRRTCIESASYRCCRSSWRPSWKLASSDAQRSGG
jgi:16S rRNA processing protein RimM